MQRAGNRTDASCDACGHLSNNRANICKPGQQPRHVALWLLVAVLTLYLLPGLVGHDPWKPDEGYVFDITYHIIRTGHWIIPRLAGQPFMEKPPLYYLVAAGFAKAFSPWLPLHDGARLASGLFMALSVLWLALAARKVWGNHSAASAALALVACLGLIQEAHFMVVDVALLCAFCLALYGLVLYPHWGRRAGWIFGTGVGAGFMAKGLLAPGVFALTALLLPLTCRQCRTRDYLWFLAIALLAASPWLLIWPTLLFLKSRALFMVWFWNNNFGRLTGSSHLGGRQPHGYYATVLPWFSWPVWPFAALQLWRQRRSLLERADLQALCLMFAVLLSVLWASATARALYAMPLLPSLAVLAAGTAGSAPGWMKRVVSWLGVGLFGVLTVALWILWAIALRTQAFPITALARGRFPLHYPFAIHAAAFAAALAATLALPVLLRHSRGRAENHWIAWVASMSVVWCLLNTLYLPWINSAMSFRGVFDRLARHLPAGHGCIAGQGLLETQRGMLDYFEGIDTVPIDKPRARHCRWLIVQGRHAVDHPRPGWILVWRGHRPADDNEAYGLFKRRVTGSDTPPHGR